MNLLDAIRAKGQQKEGLKKAGGAPAPAPEPKKPGAVGGFDPDRMSGLNQLMAARTGDNNDDGSGTSDDSDWE